MDHTPTLEGSPVSAAGHRSALLRGFREMYGLLESHRQELLGPGGLLSGFAHRETRVIVRPTLFYMSLLGEGFHPDVLGDTRERELLFDGLWGEAASRPRLAPLVRSEIRALEAADIPVFSARPGSRHLWTEFGERIPDYLSESSLERVEAKLKAFGEADLERQVWLIESSFDTLGASRPTREIYPFRAGAAEAHCGELLTAALRVGDRLEELAFHGPGGDVSWPVVGSEGPGWGFGPAEPGLYQGLAGISLFLAYLGEVSGARRFRDLARGAWRTLRHQLDSGRVVFPGIGGFTGWGGILYGATHLASLWKDPELLQEARSIAGQLREQIAEDRQFDVVGGAAGCVLSLRALYRHGSSEEVLGLVERCAEHLESTALDQETGCGWVLEAAGPRPLAGLSHGAGGIALALLRAAELTGRERFRDLARRAIAYERTLFHDGEGNWVDLREGDRPEGALQGSGHNFVVGWCHGAPGVGLARLSGLELFDDGVVEEEIAIALQTTLDQGFGSNHCLCHGDLGNLELILTASRVLGDRGLHSKAYRLAAGVLSGIENEGWLYGYPVRVEPLGLMVGLAGIGYGLLRLAEPGRVPSVLLLDPPLVPPSLCEEP